ncbi:ABC transporter permease [uncultured Cohaesibacter sp.]|uniref:ABC transporter permease n=1 Tax=uncultured Cohaesibacter sp. TaxID=1002546 RepID=UPI0029C7A85B|nr:ABC transporter permease [uncultured Cohaesibacter sp.]
MTQVFAKYSNILEVRMAGLTLMIGIALSLASPHFLTTANLFNLMDQSVVTGIVAIGMTFVILTGGIDLSVGSVIGVTGILLGLAMREVPIPLAIAFAVMAGAFIGSISGILVAVFGLAPFVVTLGSMAICRSLAYVFSNQRTISDVPDALSGLVYDSLFGLQMNVLILIVLYVVAWIYLTHSKGGRTIYAIGSNKEAARISGLNVRLYSILPYVVSGALCAVAVTLIAAQIGSIDPLAGNAMELDAIAAVVIGGASLFGGRGSIVGTLFGVLIMVMIRNGMNLLGVSPFWQGTAIGTIIIAAVLAERLLSGRSRHH